MPLAQNMPFFWEREGGGRDYTLQLLTRILTKFLTKNLMPQILKVFIKKWILSKDIYLYFT